MSATCITPVTATSQGVQPTASALLPWILGEHHPMLIHGTTRVRARRILDEGFRPGRGHCATGRGTCASEAISVAYDHGGLEDGGAILLIDLVQEAAVFMTEDGRIPDGGCDAALQTHGSRSALRLYAGNVWVLGPEVVARVRLLDKDWVRCLLAEEITTKGPSVAYNGWADVYRMVIMGEMPPHGREKDFNLVSTHLRRLHLLP